MKDSKKIAASLFTLAALALVMLTSIRVYLMGTVSDASGAVIPKAQVSSKNVASGEVRTVTTNAAGLYTLPNLLPGSYDVTATAPGFATEIRSSITLTVGAQQTLNMTIQIGQVSQKVEVTGEAPVVQPAQEIALTDYETVCRETCCWRSAPNKLLHAVDA